MRVDLILFEPFFYQLNHFDKLILHTWLHPRNYCLSTKHTYQSHPREELSMYSSYKPHYTKFTLNVPNKSIWNKVVVSCYPQNLEENNNPFNEYCYLFIFTTCGYKWKLHFRELNDFHFFHCLLSSKQWIASYYCKIVSGVHKIILLKVL